ERKETTTGKSAALLAGLVHCAGCSHAMSPSTMSRKARSAKDSAKPLTVYRCMKHKTGGTGQESSIVSRRPFDAYVLDQFLSRHASVELEQITDAETDALVAAAIEAENAYRSVLDNAELAKQLGPVDHAKMVATYKANMDEAKQAIPDTRNVSG